MRFVSIRLHNAIAYAVAGAYIPYAPVYLNRLGLDDADIGLVLGAWALPFLVMPTVATHLADRHLSNRALLIAGYLGSAASLALFALADSVPLLFAGALLFGVAYTPMFGLIDGLAFTMMEQAGGRRPSFSSIRIWGTIGYIVPSIALFAVMGAGGSGREPIVAAALCALLGALTGASLPRVRRGVRAVARVPVLEAWRAIRRPPVRVFVAALFLQLVGMSIFHTFYPRSLQELGIEAQWIGVIVQLGVVSEIPFVLGVGVLLRVLGLRGLVLAGALCELARMALIAVSSDPVVIIASQLLHGPIVASLYVIPPMYIDSRAQAGTRNSMQGIYSVLCFGGSRIVGAMLGGQVAGAGLGWAFALAGVLAGVALVWLMISFRDDRASRALAGTGT